MCAYESGLLCESGSSNAGDQTNVPESIKGSQTNSSGLGLSLVDKNSPNSKIFHVKPEITKNRLIQTEVTASQQFLPSSSVDDIEPNEASRKTKYALGKVPFELDIKANKLSLKSILDTIKRRLSPSTNSKEDREAQSSEYSSNSDNDENEKEADSDSDYVCTDELIPTSSTFNTSKEQLFIGDTFICRMCDMIVTKSVLKQHTDWCFRSQSALKLQQELLYAVINLIKDLKLETKSIPKSEEQSLKYAHGLCDILETASYIRESKIPSILARKFKNPSGKLSRLISDTSSIPTDGVLDSLLAFGTKAVELLSRKKTLAKEILGLYAEYLDLDSLNAVENYQGNILFTNNDAIESTGDISSQMVLDEIKTLETDHKDEENNGPPIGTHNSDENTDDLSIHTVHQVREKLVHEARRKKEFANDGRFQTPISKLTTLFSNILKASSNTLQTYSPAIQKSLFGAKFSKIKFPTALSVAISDFEVLRLISRGTFG